MDKIIESYELITSTDSEQVIRDVKDGIQKGWQPFGPISISSYVAQVGEYDYGDPLKESITHYAQVMVKYQEEK